MKGKSVKSFLKMTDIEIVFENEEILVINKPSGLAVQGGKGISHSLDKDLPLLTGSKIHLVHRLDMDTSGLLIVAKSPFHAAKWTKLIGGKSVLKEYVAICAGRFKKQSGTIETPVIQHGEEKNARTHFCLLGEKDYEIEGEKIILSKVRLKLDTGRMHQIRIHLSKEGVPVLGDDKHGNFRINKLFKKNLGVKKLLLCAEKLTIPVDGKPLQISIEIPDYMNLV